MNIFIKSFSRPYSLDRCICSIKKKVLNYSDIIVMDDGTEKKYMQKLITKHPDIKIVYSDTADYKYDYIMTHLEQWFYQREKKFDPAIFWSKTIREQATDAFLLLEDDFWIAENIDLQKFEQHIHGNHILYTKLIQVQHPVFSAKEEEDIKVFLEKHPALIYMLPKISKLEDVWKIYSVAGAIYKKEYYLHTFENIPFFSHEAYLLKRAVQYVQQANSRKERIRFAKSDVDIVKIGMSSTAIGRRDEIAQGFNAYLCNKVLNECWYAGMLDPMYNYPFDFPEEYILTMFHNMSLESKQIECWRQWRSKWLKTYKEIGIEFE